MARSRTLKPGFFSNDELAECSMAARLLYAGLWCIADREGRLEDRPKRIKSLVLPYDDVNVDELLDDLQVHKFICRYEADGVKCIEINKFRVHQTPHPKEAKSDLPSPCREKVCTSNVISIASKGSVGRGLEECKEEECKEEESKKEPNLSTAEQNRNGYDNRISGLRLPDVDGSTAAVIRKLGEINREAKRSPEIILSAVDRDKLSDAIVQFGSKKCESLWHWAINSPHPRAKFYQQKKMLTVKAIFGPDKVGELMDFSQQHDAWAAEIREGPSQSDDDEAAIQAALKSIGATK